jgi:hypothetical protein
MRLKQLMAEWRIAMKMAQDEGRSKEADDIEFAIQQVEECDDYPGRETEPSKYVPPPTYGPGPDDYGRKKTDTAQFPSAGKMVEICAECAHEELEHCQQKTFDPVHENTLRAGYPCIQIRRPGELKCPLGSFERSGK